MKAFRLGIQDCETFLVVPFDIEAETEDEAIALAVGCMASARLEMRKDLERVMGL